MPQVSEPYLGQGDEDRVSADRDHREPSPAAGAQASGEFERLDGGPSSLPLHIAGGFTGVADDLDRRSRDWTMMVRLLEQQRLHLETAEMERDRLYKSFEVIIPEVRESGALLETLMSRTKSGDVSGNLSAQFADNLRALDKLENLSRALTANLLWTRSSWEQYARSVIGAQKMREDLQS